MRNAPGDLTTRQETQRVTNAIRDKLPGISDTFLAENTILELAQDDKLFKL
jgi:hypothetical protein